MLSITGWRKTRVRSPEDSGERTRGFHQPVMLSMSVNVDVKRRSMYAYKLFHGQSHPRV